MPNETIEIFNGTAAANTITLSDGFINANYLYLVYNTPNIDLEIDISLQVYLTPTVQRAVRLENDNILNTVSITLIPTELYFSPFNMRVAIITNQNVNISIFAVRTECCGEKIMSDIKSQLNRIEAYSAISSISDAVSAIAQGFLAFTVGTVAIELAGGNLLRKGLSIIAPSVAGAIVQGAQILFDNVPQFVLTPGQYFIADQIPTGTISALSLDGNPIQLGIKEYF